MPKNYNFKVDLRKTKTHGNVNFKVEDSWKIPNIFFALILSAISFNSISH